MTHPVKPATLMPMTTTTKVTKRDAEKVLAAVHEAFPAYVEDACWEGRKGCPEPGDHTHPTKTPPRLVQDYDNGRVPWAIVWEDGSPYEWGFNFPNGGMDEEWGWKVKAVAIPGSVHLECEMSFIVGIYPA